MKKMLCRCKYILLFFVISVFFGSSIFAQSRAIDLSDNSVTEVIRIVEEPLPDNTYTTPNDRGDIVKFLIEVILKVVYPLIFFVAIITGIAGIISIMFSDSESSIRQGINYIGFGALGIVLVTTARFFTDWLIGAEDNQINNDTGGTAGVINEGQGFNDVFNLAAEANDILLPFITLGSYLAIGVLFVILLINAIKLLLSQSDEVVAKSKNILIRNAGGIIIILAAKRIVDFLYGQRADTEIAITSNTIGPLHAIINVVMGLLFLTIVIVIIAQAYQLLIKADDPSTIEKLRKSLLFIGAGVLVIGASYIIVNFLIVSRI